MKKMKLVGALVLGASVFSASAEEAVKFVGTVPQADADFSADLLTTPSNWEGGEISAEKDYEATASGYYSVGGDNVFNGKSLTLSKGYLAMSGTGQTFTFANDGVIFNGANINNANASGVGHKKFVNPTIRGRMHFAKSLRLAPYRTTSKNTFIGPSISAASGVTLSIQAPSGNANTCKGLLDHRNYFIGDMSEFYGTLALGGSSAIPGLALLCTDFFGGTVKVWGGDHADSSATYYGSGTFGPCSTNAEGTVKEFVGEVKVKNLTINDNGNLVLAVNLSDLESGCGHITVTDTFSAPGRVNVFLQFSNANYSMTEQIVPLLTAPLGSELGNVVWQMPVRTQTYACTTCVTTNEAAQTETFCLVVHKFSTHVDKKEDANRRSSEPDNFPGNWYWDYKTDPRTTFDPETIYVSGYNVGDDGLSGYGGKKLVLYSGCYFTYGTTQVDVFEFYGSSYFDNNATGNCNIGSELRVYGNNTIRQDTKSKSSGIVLTKKSVLKGTGKLTFAGTTNTTVTIRGDVSGFSGRMAVTRYADAVLVNDLTNVTLRIDNAAQLGTPVDTETFVADALTLDNFSRLQVTNTTAMTYSCRGLRVNGNGGVDVSAGQAFTYAASLTLNGRLYKQGGGVFALGGELTVPADAAAPVVDVQAGAIAAASAQAFDGAAITFAEGASICVDAGTADADLAARGLVNTLAETPFATTAADGRIGVSVRATGPTGEKAKAVAVCTLPTGSAFADPDKYVLVGTARAGDVRFASFSSTPNEDGTTTVFANFSEKPGAVLIVR